MTSRFIISGLLFNDEDIIHSSVPLYATFARHTDRHAYTLLAGS